MVPRCFGGVKACREFEPKRFVEIVLKGSPDLMHYMVYVFFVYAFVNFLLFIGKTPSGSSGTNPPASVWRGFSGHWMAFYSAALAILYAGARAVDTSPGCGSGHLALPNSTYCPKCGSACNASSLASEIA